MKINFALPKFTRVLGMQMGAEMEGIKNSINEIVQEINEISNYLYQQKLNRGYVELNNTLAKIMNIVDAIYLYSKEENNLSFDQNRLVHNLTLAMKAMEEKDSVLLADILVYEIAEQLKEVESLI